MNDDGDGCVVAMLTFVLGLLMGCIAGSGVQSDLDESMAVQHGAAHYDPITAKFQWNNPAVEASK